MPSNLKRKNYPACGRLIVLQAAGNRPIYDAKRTENYQGMVAINFPAMPETIELARSADYMVTTNQAFPDGIHQYRGTAPLKIPIKFKLHAFDREYCPKGVLSLLEVAAEMHALTLPITPDAVYIDVGEAAVNNVQPAGRTDVELSTKADQPAFVGNLSDQTYNVYPPPTCYLELIITDRESPGIACIGYVSESTVILHGPWLEGQGVSQNLPNMGEFSFTFVHHPGHSNAYNYGRSAEKRVERQAFAGDVRAKLYNTRHLLTQARYRGYGDNVD